MYCTGTELCTCIGVYPAVRDSIPCVQVYNNQHVSFFRVPALRDSIPCVQIHSKNDYGKLQKLVAEHHLHVPMNCNCIVNCRLHAYT